MIKCDSANIPPAPSPPPIKPGPVKTTNGHDICPGSGDISNFVTTDADKCNMACYGNQECTAYVLTRGRCFLKNCLGPVVASQHSVLSQVPSRQKKSRAGHWEIKGGDAQTGVLKTYFSGPRAPGYSPMKKQGAIILGIGGDNSDGAIGTFYEGAMVAGVSSNMTDSKLQSNIVAAGYGK